MPPRLQPRRAGFTMVEVILVVVILMILASVAVPFMSGAMKGHKLRTSARLIQRMAAHGRSLAIWREETLTMVINPSSGEVYLGGATTASTNDADGRLDQEVFKRLNYVEDDESGARDIGVEREVRKFLAEGLEIRDFRKEQTEEDNRHPDLKLVRFHPNGRGEWFQMELVDKHGVAIRLENDPISGRVSSEYTQ